jgi:hypothetical protein
MWFFELRREPRPTVFDDRVLAKVFGTLKNKENGIIRSFMMWTQRHMSLG